MVLLAPHLRLVRHPLTGKLMLIDKRKARRAEDALFEMHSSLPVALAPSEVVHKSTSGVPPDMSPVAWAAMKASDAAFAAGLLKGLKGWMEDGGGQS